MGTSNKNKYSNWKGKAISRGKEKRKLKQEVKRQKERAAKWKEKFYECRAKNDLQKVKRHHYPLELIWLSIIMHIDLGISLRGVSKSLMKVGQLFEYELPRLSHVTIRNWCLKYGFHILSQGIPSGKYALICDESVEIGKEHLMLILAVPIQTSSPITALKMEDVYVLDLKVQSSWKSEELSKMLQSKIAKHQLDVAYVISDKGNVLKKAYQTCELTWIGDCTHEMANQTKRIFAKDEPFHNFVNQMNALRSKWIMSKNNLYTPPSMRSKSRFHQIFSVYKWGEFVMENWTEFDQKAKEQLDFVQQQKDLVLMMKHFYKLIDVFAIIFKSKGIQKQSIEEWEKSVKQYEQENELCDKAKQFITKMNDYLVQQQLQLPHQNQILCCSDIVESMFGKYKNKGGPKIITDDVLKIVAYPDMKKIEDVKKAMTKVKMKKVLAWKRKNTILSKLAKLKKMRTKSAA